jgi:hypothetical protein
VSERSSRRRLRLRRKRKGETFAKILDVPDVVDVAGALDVSDIVNAADGAAVAEVVGHMGCCVVEAVGSLAVVFALLLVPAFLLLH